MYPAVVTVVQSNEADIKTVTNAIYSGAIYRFYAKPRTDKNMRRNIRDAFRHCSMLRNVMIESQLPKLLMEKRK